MSSIEKAVERFESLSGKRPTQKVMPEKPVAEPNRIPHQHTENREAAPGYHIHLDRLEQEGFLTPGNAQGMLAEEYRMLKRPLLRNAFGKSVTAVPQGNLIMVTSALPGEGKTFTSLNLAMSMAMELDSTVLIVDCDVVKPALTKVLGLEGAPGLTDVLLDRQIELGDVIVNTDIAKLRVLPAGQIHANSTELLASEQMENLANELSSRYSDRVILFDSPPLLVTSQASVLSHLMGQIVVVVESGRTPQHVVKEAVSLLDDNKIIGMALNKTRRSYNKEIYGGYYGDYGQ